MFIYFRYYLTIRCVIGKRFFSHLVVCHFSRIMVSFDVKKLYSFKNFHLLIIVFSASVIESPFRTSFPVLLMWRLFPPITFIKFRVFGSIDHHVCFYFPTTLFVLLLQLCSTTLIWLYLIWRNGDTSIKCFTIQDCFNYPGSFMQQKDVENSYFFIFVENCTGILMGLSLNL